MPCPYRGSSAVQERSKKSGHISFSSGARFCTAHDEVRDYFRHRTRLHEVVPPEVQREQYRARSAALRAMLGAA